MKIIVDLDTLSTFELVFALIINFDSIPFPIHKSTMSKVKPHYVWSKFEQEQLIIANQKYGNNYQLIRQKFFPQMNLKQIKNKLFYLKRTQVICDTAKQQEEERMQNEKIDMISQIQSLMANLE